MKKFIKFLTIFALLSVMILSGCSCSPTIPLSFNSAFFDNGTPTRDYSETLTYKVSYLNGDDQNYPHLKKSDSLSGVIKDFVIDDGGFYKTNLMLVPLTSSKVPEEVRHSNLVGANGLIKDTDSLFYLSSHLKYSGKLVLNGEDNFHEISDEILIETFFLMKDNAYAPVYAKSTSKMSLVSVDNENVAVGLVEYNYQTLYSLEDYTIKASTTDFGYVAYSISTGEETQKEDRNIVNTLPDETYDYSIKTSVDNAQLLFVLRNFTTTLEQTSGLPTIAPAYGEAKTLVIRHDKSKNVPLTFSYNGANAQENETVPVKTLSYAINDTNASGVTQYLTYQTGKSSAQTSTVPSRALLVEYAFPMPVYGAMTILGGLKCTLVSAECNQ